MGRGRQRSGTSPRYNNGNAGVMMSANGTIYNISAFNNAVGVCMTDGAQTIRNVVSLGNGNNSPSSNIGNFNCGLGGGPATVTASANITTGTASGYWVNPAGGDFNLRVPNLRQAR